MHTCPVCYMIEADGFIEIARLEDHTLIQCQRCGNIERVNVDRLDSPFWVKFKAGFHRHPQTPPEVAQPLAEAA